MNPIAFSIFGLPIRWYGILISTGMILGIILAQYTCKLKRIDYEVLLNAVLISIPLGIIGARAYYVLFEWNYYMANKAEILNIREGGLAIHGGLIFGLTAAIIYFRKKRMSFLKFADAAAPSIILAQALGRWGNFFNQEAHGGVVSQEFIKHFPKFVQNGMYIKGAYYHPTFLYESIWDVSVCIILLVILNKMHKNRSEKDGLVLFSYLGLYSIGRFFIEGLRTDSLMLGPLRIAQVVSLVGIAIWIIALIIINKRHSRRY